MAAPLRSPAPEIGESAPPLRLLQGSPVDGEAGIGRGVLIGGISGFFGLGSLVAFGGWAAGMVLPAAIGFGIFVGSWGGAGFGAMMGGTIAFTRGLDAEHRT